MASNSVIVFILANIAFVSISTGITLFFISWRKNKAARLSFDSLLEKINETQPSRKEFYVDKLAGTFKLDANQADELSGALMRQEKAIYHGVIKAQLLRSSEAIGNLEKDISEALNSYLNEFTRYFDDHLSSENNQNTSPNATQTEEDSVDDDIELVHEEDGEDIPEDTTETQTSVNTDGGNGSETIADDTQADDSNLAVNESPSDPSTENPGPTTADDTQESQSETENQIAIEATTAPDDSDNNPVTIDSSDSNSTEKTEDHEAEAELEMATEA